MPWAAIDPGMVSQDRRIEPSLLSRYGRQILLTAALLLALSSGAIIKLHGLAWRFPSKVASIAAFYDYAKDKPYRQGQCFITSKESASDFDRAACLRLDPGRRNVLLLGDSHAAQLWTALRDSWPDTNFLQATASGCKPLLATTGAFRCTTMMAEMLHTFLPAHRLDGVVISALWEPDDLASLKDTIAYLKPLTGRITIFGPVLRYGEPVATTLARAILRGDSTAMRGHELSGQAAFDARMQAEIGAQTNYVSLYKAQCPGGDCRLFAAPGVPMQFDYHHLTKAGAAILIGAIRASGRAAP